MPTCLNRPHQHGAPRLVFLSDAADLADCMWCCSFQAPVLVLTSDRAKARNQAGAGYLECTPKELETIFHQYRPRLDGFFRTLGVCPDTRQDLIQATFGNAVQHLHKVHDEVHLERWLFRIGRNLLRHEQRKSHTQKRNGVNVPWDEVESEFSPGIANDSFSEMGVSPIDRLLAQEEQERFKQAVEKLPEQMKRCVNLFYFQEKSIKEIVIIMRVRSGTVKSHLGQARKRLKDFLT